METAGPLIAAIHDAPEDTTRWRVFADWLTEQGDERGAAIAIGLRLHEERRTLPDAERKALRERYVGLCSHRTRLRGVTGRISMREIEWRHGFVWGVRFLGAGGIGAFLSLRGHPAGALLHEATFSAPGPKGLRALAQGGALGVRRVRFYRGAMGAEEIEVLGDRLDDIDALDLSIDLQEEGLAALLARSGGAGPRTLNVSGVAGGDDSAARIASAPWSQRLEALDLAWSRIGPRGAEALAGSAHLAGLRRLCLTGNTIRKAGALAIARSPHLARLTSLDLSQCGVSSRAVEEIAKHLTDLVSLDLSHNRVEDRGALALAALARRGRLASVNIEHSGASKAGYAAVVEAMGGGAERVVRG